MEEFSESFTRSSKFIAYWSTTKDSHTALVGLLNDARSANFLDKSRTQGAINKWDELIGKTLESFENLETDYVNSKSKKVSVLAEDEFLERERTCWYEIECFINFYASHYFTIIELKCILEKDIKDFNEEIEKLKKALDEIEEGIDESARQDKNYVSKHISDIFTDSPGALANKILAKIIPEIDKFYVEQRNKIKSTRDQIGDRIELRSKFGTFLEEYAKFPTIANMSIDTFAVVLAEIQTTKAAAKNLERMVTNRAKRCDEVAKRFEGKDPVGEMQEFIDTTPKVFETEKFLVFQFKALKKCLDDNAKEQLNKVKTAIKNYQHTTDDVRKKTFFGNTKVALKNMIPSEYINSLHKELTMASEKYNERVEQNMASIQEEIEDYMDS